MQQLAITKDGWSATLRGEWKITRGAVVVSDLLFSTRLSRKAGQVRVLHSLPPGSRVWLTCQSGVVARMVVVVVVVVVPSEGAKVRYSGYPAAD